jgi:phospholipid N-methyltransferase
MDFSKIADENLRAELEQQYNTEITKYKMQVKTIEGKLTDLQTKLSEKDNEILGVKELLGFDKDTPINPELIKSKLGEFKSEDISKIESKYNEIIQELNQKYQSKINDYESKINSFESEKKELILESKLKEVLPSLPLQAGALEDILYQLKNGADINEHGEVVYRDGDMILRNEQGLPLTIQDKIEMLKKNKPFYFKSEIKEGSNTPNVNMGNGVSQDPFSARMQNRLAQRGITL